MIILAVTSVWLLLMCLYSSSLGLYSSQDEQERPSYLPTSHPLDGLHKQWEDTFSFTPLSVTILYLVHIFEFSLQRSWGKYFNEVKLR